MTRETKTICGKPGYTGLNRIIKATYYSIKGIKSAFKYESAIRQELAIITTLTPIALLLEITMLEKIALIGVLINMLTVELINSAIEAVVDRVGTEFHELSGRAKDMGSAAVFVSLCFAMFTWFGIIVL